MGIPLCQAQFLLIRSQHIGPASLLLLQTRHRYNSLNGIMRTYLSALLLVVAPLLGSALQTSRRAFLTQSVATAAAAATLAPQSAFAAPEILTTTDGKIKYAVLKSAKEKGSPIKGDIVAIEYTGYLIDGTIFDATHAEGKSNALMFELGGNAVIDGVSIDPVMPRAT